MPWQPLSWRPHVPLVARYHRLPAEPPPETLAQLLHDAQLAEAASRRLDDFDRLKRHHDEARKGQIKLAVGMVGLALSIAPGFPDTVRTCRPGAGEGGSCAARLSATIGGILALGISLWSGYDAWTHPDRLAVQVAKMNAEIVRRLQAARAEGQVPALFDAYEAMSPDERRVLRARLHEHARQPRHSAA